MISNIYLIRHAESTDNRDIVSSGTRDVPLSENGIEEAKLLKEQLKDVKIDLIYTSPMKRCTQTIDIIMESRKGVEIVKDARLKERAYGILEGRRKFGLPFYLQWIRNFTRRSYRFAPPGGENFVQVWERVMPFVKEVESKAKKRQINILICAHHNSMRPLKNYFGGQTIRQALNDPSQDKDIKHYQVNVSLAKS